MAEVIVTGIVDFERALGLTKEKASLAARRFVTEGADIIADSAKKQFRARPSGSRTVSRTGRVYYKASGPYASKRPNPTIRTGNTRNSIRRAYVRDLGEGKWESGTGPSTFYAPYVEFGTRYIHTPAFPFMADGTRNAEGDLKALAERVFRESQE